MAESRGPLWLRSPRGGKKEKGERKLGPTWGGKKGEERSRSRCDRFSKVLTRKEGHLTPGGGRGRGEKKHNQQQRIIIKKKRERGGKGGSGSVA